MGGGSFTLLMSILLYQYIIREMSPRHPKSFITWNVNSLKAICEKNKLQPFLKHESPDIFAMSETKLNGSEKEKEFLQHLDAQFPEYPYKLYNTSIKKGYSGTAIWCKLAPMYVMYGFDEILSEIDIYQEGRIITVEYPKFYIVQVYTPNAGENLQRIKYRTEEWDIKFRHFIKKLEKKKPVLVGGDLNCAPEEIDIFKPEAYHQTAGFTNAERSNFRKLMKQADLVDSFREKHPMSTKYTYWTYLFNARFYKKGWRIDFWLVSRELASKIKKALIWDDQLGSDHAPVGLVL